MDILSPEFQSELLRVVVQDHAFLLNNRSLIDPKYFKDKTDALIAKSVVAYFDKYNATPNRATLIDVLVKKGFNPEAGEAAVDALFTEKVTQHGYIRDSLRQFVQSNELRDVLAKCQEHLQFGRLDAVLHDVRECVSKFQSDAGVGDDFFATAKATIASFDRKEQSISTGIHALDEKMSGGGIRGTLNVILTPPNKGKTSTLVNLGKAAVLGGHRVVHITTELSSEITRRRYLMSMVGMSKREIIQKKKTAYDRVLHIGETVMADSLIVKRFPTNTATVKDLDRYLQSVKNQLGFVPDMLIVDYGALLKPERPREERRLELDEIYNSLRDLNVEYNMVGWTAHQTNRRQDKEEDALITNKDLAEAFGIAGIVDVIISVNQTLKEKRYNEARLFLAKNRDDESEITIPVRVDWTRIRMTNYDRDEGI